MSAKMTFQTLLLSIIIIFSYIIEVMPNSSLIFNITLCLCLIFYVAFYFWNKKLSTLVILVGITTLILMIMSQNVTRVSLFIFLSLIYFVNNLDLKRKKILFILSLICMFTIITSYFVFGFNNNYDVTIYRPFKDEFVYRHCLGFVHPNIFMLNWLSLCLIYLSIYKYSHIKMLIILMLTICFYFLTQSRTVFFGMIFLFFVIICSHILKLNKKLANKNFANLTRITFISMFFISIIASLLLHNTIVDTLLTGRLTINYNMLKTGLSIFGNASLENVIFDNSYLHMLLTKGLLFVIIYCVIFFSYTKKVKFISYYQYIFLFVLFLLAFMEVCLLKYNVLLAIILILNSKLLQNNYINS